MRKPNLQKWTSDHQVGNIQELEISKFFDKIDQIFRQPGNDLV